MLLKHYSPDQEVVEQCWKIHKDHKDIIQRYFIGENQFIGGDDVSVADLMLVVTLQQTALTGCHHDEFHQYIAMVRQRTNTSFFDELDFQTKSKKEDNISLLTTTVAMFKHNFRNSSRT